MSKYEAVIGMEVHAELLTASKMFCGCKNSFGGEPNTRCCPVCLGMPGALPVINRKAVEYVIRASLALNCRITANPKFDRKNYFYPDLPKGYQISQYDLPIGVQGWLDISVGDETKRVHIRRVHLEEDTGKLFHVSPGESEVDFNRSGVPLMEIVTEFPPDMHTADEAKTYLEKLRAILTFIGVSDGKMEEGSLRCEPNLSVRCVGSDTFGTKTEIKNLNSFRAVQRGIEYEVKRQTRVIDSGGSVTQETRGWNETKQETFAQRSKEVEQEYRYFPEPDLVPMFISEEWIEQTRFSMPELPEAALTRIMGQYAITRYDAEVLTQSRELAAYFEGTVAAGADAKAAANWILGELSRLHNLHAVSLTDAKVRPEHLAELLTLIDRGTVSGKMAKGILEKMFESGQSAASLAATEGPQISDAHEIDAMIEEAIGAHSAIWAEILSGDVRKAAFIVGQVMRVSKGKANPQEVNRLIQERITSGN